MYKYISIYSSLHDTSLRIDYLVIIDYFIDYLQS